MSNIISNRKYNQRFSMNNGLTDAFFHILCLSSSQLAKEEFQKDIAIWFAQRDSSIFGSGFTGFDMIQMIWDYNIFEDQKAFLEEAVQSAGNKNNWIKLNYTPKEVWLNEALEQFEKLILTFQKNDIDTNSQYPIIEFEDQYEKCNIHGIYLHHSGCNICNTC